MPGILISVGCKGMTIETLLDTLKRNNISCVVDVRCRYETENQLSKSRLREALYRSGIYYRDYPQGNLTLDTDDKKAKNASDYVDFQRAEESGAFHGVATKIKAGLDAGYSFCLLGYQTKPELCHRSFLVGHGLLLLWMDVLHLAEGREPEWESALEKRVVDAEFPEFDQLELFAIEKEPFEEKYEKVRRMRNKDIGRRWLLESKVAQGG